MFPKGRESITKQSNIINWFKCGRTECDDEYIGESARTFEERYREHLKAPSPIVELNNVTGHTTSVETFMIIGREGHNMARAIKDAIYITVNNPTLNGNIGKYNLPHIWYKVLFSIPDLKTKKAPLHHNISVSRGLPPIDLHNNTWLNKYLCTTTSVLQEVHQ